MKFILLVVILFSSLFDTCLASEFEQKTSSATLSSSEFREKDDDECCGKNSESTDDESKSADPLCTHCSNCHLWNFSLLIHFVTSPSMQTHIFPYDFNFTSPSLDGPKRPPKTNS